jgi:hypothetical protein
MFAVRSSSQPRSAQSRESLKAAGGVGADPSSTSQIARAPFQAQVERSRGDLQMRPSAIHRYLARCFPRARRAEPQDTQVPASEVSNG